MKAEAVGLKEKGSPRRVMVPVFIFVLALGLFWIGYALVDRRGPIDGPHPIPRDTLQRNAVVNFDPFLIPLGMKSKYTLISLSFSLELPNGEVEETVKRRMNEIRGFIFDILREDFTEGEGIPSMQTVKEGVSRAFRVALPGLQVKDVYISRFLAL